MLAGSVVTIIILECFREALQVEGEYNQLDAIWRIQMGLALVPAFATLIPRLRMPEGQKFIQSLELNTPASGILPGASLHDTPVNGATTSSSSEHEHQHTGPVSAEHEALDAKKKHEHLANNPNALRDLEKLNILVSRKAKLDTFFIYFSEWRHLKTLIGTASCWFLLDIAFYGTNLNQSVLLADIGYSTGKTHYDVLMKNAIGNLIIAVAGYVPGYFFTIFFVEKLGRKWIQIQGFLIAGSMFAILAGGYEHLSTGGKFACFALAQVYHSIFYHIFILPIILSPSVSMKTKTDTRQQVLLQLRPQRNNFHHPR